MNLQKKNIGTLSNIKTSKDIEYSICDIFQNAQVNLKSHKKLVIVLKNVFKKSIALNHHKIFFSHLTALINGVLLLKKGNNFADRIVKFCSSFLFCLTCDDQFKSSRLNSSKNINLQCKTKNKIKQTEQSKFSKHLDRFIDHLIRHLLRGINSKNKNVRYRVVQLLAYIMTYVKELESDLFELLYVSLSNKIIDKESSVRIQSVLAISRFQHFNFDELVFRIPLNQKIIEDLLINSLINDTSFEVRRVALLNIVKNERTFFSLIERAKDLNNINRRLFYTKVLIDLGGFKNLDFSTKEKLLTWGLNDKDLMVRNSITKLITFHWFKSLNSDLFSLIENLCVKESKIAEKVLHIFFNNKPDVLESIKIDEASWKSLTVENVFLYKVFYQICNKKLLFDLIDLSFPEPILYSEILNKYLNLRSDFLLKNQNFVTQNETNNKCIQIIENELFITENHLSFIKTQFISNENLLSQNFNDVEKCNKLIGVIEKKIFELENNTDQNKIIKNNESSNIVSADLISNSKFFLNLNDDELNKNIELPLEDLKKLQIKITNDLKCYQLTIKDLENKIYILKEDHNKHSQIFKDLFQKKIDSKNSFFFSKEHVEFNEKLNDLDFIIKQLLLISIEYDFSDEVGRRKMLQIMSKFLYESNLTENLFLVSLKVLKKLSICEKDFLMMVCEIINDIRDNEIDNEAYFSAVSNSIEIDSNDSEISDFQNQETMSKTLNVSKNLKSNSMELKSENNRNNKLKPKLPSEKVIINCLLLIMYSLELIENFFDEILVLDSIYSELVLYAINNTKNKNIFTLGLKCLGLFSLINKNVAINSFPIFYKKIKLCCEDVKVICIKAVIDVFFIHKIYIIQNKLLFQFARIFYKFLNTFEMSESQCVIAEGLCKLFLCGIFDDFTESNKDEDINLKLELEKQLFESLVLNHFHHFSENNMKLKQITSYCIPVYAFNHPKHQHLIATISGDCIYRLFCNEMETTKHKSTLTPLSVIEKLIYWCNPQNLINLTQDEINKQDSHALQCICFLQLITQDLSKNVKKSILNNLKNFFINEEIDINILKDLMQNTNKVKNYLLNNDNHNNLFFDKSSKKNIESFESNLNIILQKCLTKS